MKKASHFTCRFHASKLNLILPTQGRTQDKSISTETKVLSSLWKKLTKTSPYLSQVEKSAESRTEKSPLDGTAVGRIYDPN
jgi:hypothetical protein